MDVGRPCKLSYLTLDLSADPGSVGEVARDTSLPGGPMHVYLCAHTGLSWGAGRAQRRQGCEPSSSFLPAVGPRQTVSSEPGFHHFTWKDLKAPRCCRASMAAARRRRKLPAIWKKEQGSHHLLLADISIPDTQSVSCAHPHWTDRETEAERNRARVSEKEQHKGQALGAFPRHPHTPPLPTLQGDPP